MSTMIRFRRMGTTNRPYFRLVAMEKATRRNGRFFDILGHYDPLHYDAVKKPEAFQVNEERVFYWMDHGAELSTAARELLRNNGTLGRWRARKVENAKGS
jgi:small subunit ribosomal protein S16